MRICMVTSVPLPPRDGIGYYVWNLSRFLVGQGHHVQIITRGQREKPFYEELEGLPVWRPRFYPTYPLHVHLHRFFVQRLVQQMESRIDIFHLHTPLPPPIRSTRPVLLTVHSTVLASAKLCGVGSMFEILTKLSAPVASLVERQLVRSSQSVTAVSRRVAEDVRRFLPGDDRAIEVTWNGVDPQFFSPSTCNSGHSEYLLFAGRLALSKGLPDLVQSFKLVTVLHPEAKLIIAGSGLLWGRVKSLIEQSGLERRVRLLGHIDSRDRLRTLYQQARVLVLSSRQESLPTVILEAMACGTPVIATRVGSVPDVITNGVNGLLVPPRAPEKLANAICRLLDDTELQTRLGVAARRTVEQRFSWQVVGSNYLRCYRALLSGADRCIRSNV